MTAIKADGNIPRGDLKSPADPQGQWLQPLVSRLRLFGEASGGGLCDELCSDELQCPSAKSDELCRGALRR